MPSVFCEKNRRPGRQQKKGCALHDGGHSLFYEYFALRLVKPLHIAEVLAVGQIVVLGEHTHARAEGSGLVGLYHSLEGVEVALV